MCRFCSPEVELKERKNIYGKAMSKKAHKGRVAGSFVCLGRFQRMQDLAVNQG